MSSTYTVVKSAGLQIHANFHENFQNLFTGKICEANKESK
jgi:hypothetical protein